jgi:hypothetical protein
MHQKLHAFRKLHQNALARKRYDMLEDGKYFITVNEKFPNIAKKIKVFWGHPEFVTLMHELQHDTGGRLRAGFPSDVLMALHELESEHNQLWPQLARKDKNIWTIDGF